VEALEEVEEEVVAVHILLKHGVTCSVAAGAQ
jgi:hypothetical protein